MRPQRCGVRSKRTVLRVAASVAFAVAAAIGTALAITIASINGWPIDRDTPLLAGYLTLIYLLPTLLGLGTAAVVMLVLGQRPGARFFLALAVAASVFLNGLQRFISSVQLLSVVPHMTAIGVLDLLVVAVVAGAAGLAVASRRWANAAAWLGTSAALLVALTLLHEFHEKPLERDLAALVPAALEAVQAPAPASAPSRERLEGARVVVIGFDGLSWEVLLPLLRRGELPHFHALLEKAAYGYLETLPFTVSPVVWETIATGQPPERHGFGYHVDFEFPGVTRRVRNLPSFQLTHGVMRIRGFLSLISRVGVVRQAPADATDAKVARLWEIASRSGLSVGVYDWLNTAPAAPIDGFIHGYPPVAPRFFPPDLEQGIPKLPEIIVGNDTSIGWVRASEPYQRVSYERFFQLALRFHPDVLFYYTHLSDAVNHWNWKREVWGDDIFISGVHHPDVEPGPAISAVIRILDDFVGDVLARAPENARIAIVSDHGFDFRGYEHDNGPPGVIILAGPGVRPGPMTGASIYDVTPTLLNWLGLAVADDMPGTPLAIAANGPLDHARMRVATYGPSLTALQSGEVDEAALRSYEEYLRALGYIK